MCYLATIFYVMKGEKQKEQYHHYIEKRQSTQLSPSLQGYFESLQQIVQKKNGQKKTPLPSPFHHAFSKLTTNQQIRFLHAQIDFIHQIGKVDEQKRYSLAKQYSGSTEMSLIIQTTCQSSTHNPIKIMCAPQLVFKLDLGRQIITLTSSGTNQIIEIHHYLVTKVSDKKIRLIPAVDQSRMFYRLKKQQFTFLKPILTNIYEELFLAIIKIKNQQLIAIELQKLPSPQKLSPTKEERKIQKKLEKERRNSELKLQFEDKVFLNKKNFKHLLQFKVQAYEKIKESMPYFTAIHHKLMGDKINNINIYKSQKDQSLFKLEGSCGQPAYILYKKIVQAFDSCNKNNQIVNRSELVLESQLLQEIFGKQYQAVYEKYLFQNSVQQMIFIKEFSGKPVSAQQKNEVIFMKAIENIIIVNFLSFLSAKIQPTSSSSCRLTIFAEFNISDLMNDQSIMEYFQDIICIIENAFDRKISKRSSYRFSIPNPMMRNLSEGWEHSGRNSLRTETEVVEKEIFYQFGDPDEQQNQLFNIMQDSSSSKTSSQTTYNFSNIKFSISPIPNFDINSELQTKHYLQDNWTRSKKGGMLCLNQALLNQHKKIFKYLITSIGTNVLKGNNVLNVSLPVTIFKKQSHLQMLAKSFSMAPKLLEGVTNPLQRMKRALILMISVGNLGISIQKPFYPHLGQTLQVWIAGCPIYLEQITRYPPTGAYLLKGRGYDIYGQVQPKIGFGLNSGKGYSERPSYIKFEDGTQIQVSYAKLVVNGLFVGQRQFNFEGKMFAYDRKNNLFLQANYGPKDGRFLSRSQQPQDYLWGQIYETTPDFREKFQKKIPRAYPKEKQIRKTLSTFQGIWNSVINFDGVEYFDFGKEMTNKVIAQQYALPSDCRFRKDLRALIKGDLQQAQREKTALEEAQRRDRKLRKQHE